MNFPGAGALSPDASPATATAREKLLQSLRDSFRAARTIDPTSLAWIDELALSGHVGATRLRDRVLRTENGVGALLARDPARVEALAASSYLAALLLARRECTLAAPNPDRIVTWLGSDGFSQPGATWEEERERECARKIAGAIAGMVAAQIPLGRADLSALLPMLDRAEIRKHSSDTVGGAVVHSVAMRRLASADEEERASGERLLERAAELKSAAARAEYLLRHPEPETLCRWLQEPYLEAVQAAIDALRSVAGGLGKTDLELLKTVVDPNLARKARYPRGHGNESFGAALFYTLAHHRLDATDASLHAAGWHLLERAAVRGSRRAQLELYARRPDTDLLAQWIESGGEPAVAGALRDLVAAAGAPSRADLELLAESITAKAEHAALVYKFAKEERKARQQLLRRAAELGLLTAKIEVVTLLYEAAGDKVAFVNEFMAKYPKALPISQLLCLKLGAALERDGHDLDAALGWYTRSLGKEQAKQDAEFCYAVATRFDKRWRIHMLDDPGLALAWHERGIALGELGCFAGWLEACTQGLLGMRPDPDAALAQVARFLAAVPGFIEKRGFSSTHRDAVLGCAAASTDPAQAVKWLRVAAAMGSGRALFLIGRRCIDGAGMPASPEAARDWFRKSAERRYGLGVAALTVEGGAALGLSPPLPSLPPDSEYDNDAKLRLGMLLIELGHKERARHLLELVIAQGDAADAQLAGDLINPRRRGFGDELEIV